MKRTRLIVLILGLSIARLFAAGNELHVTAIRQISNGVPLPMQTGLSTDPRFDAFYADMVEAMPAQERAEHALQLAINRSDGAADYVILNAQNWRGQLKPDERPAAITLAAMNSPRLEVRMAGFEVQLAVDGLAKTPQEVEHLIQRLREDPRGVGPWELWHLAVLGARGIDRERIFSVLVAKTRDDSDELRRWAVVALGMFGGVGVIDPLLSTAANDRVPSIRESAFCALAQSATLQLAERYRAIPGLLAIAQDPGSDHQNIDWSYQALREITNIRDLPQQPSAWRTRLQSLRLLPRR